MERERRVRVERACSLGLRLVRVLVLGRRGGDERGVERGAREQVRLGARLARPVDGHLDGSQVGGHLGRRRLHDDRQVEALACTHMRSRTLALNFRRLRAYRNFITVRITLYSLHYLYFMSNS